MFFTQFCAKIDFSKGPVWKCIVAQAIPLTIAQLVQLLYNVVDRIYLFYQHVFTCVAEFAQEAAVAALDDPQSVETMRQSYQQRRDSFIADLKTLPGFRCIVPEGAFYAWVQIDYKGMDADAMAKYLLEEAHVVTVPGGAYGENSKNCIRMCFAADPNELKEAVKRMAAVLKEEG